MVDKEMLGKETLSDGTVAVRVKTPDWRRMDPQIYFDAFHCGDRIVRYAGRCVACGRRCYGHDDGGNDPRGILGDHSVNLLVADESGMVGSDVAMCFPCSNEEPRHRAALDAAMKTWRPKPEIVRVDLSEFAVPAEKFWEPLRADDGYDRIDRAEPHGWTAVSSWGRDGWDFLEWPYYIGFVRNTKDGFEFATNCEGDTDVYRFPTQEQRLDAMNRIAFWHWQIKGRDWVKDVYADEVPDHLKGPYSPERHG